MRRFPYGSLLTLIAMALLVIADSDSWPLVAAATVLGLAALAHIVWSLAAARRGP